MSTFLLVVLGVVVGLALFAALGLWWLKRKIGKVLGALTDAFGSVPPFRISLEPASDVDWQDAKAVDGLSAELEALGYRRAGDFDIPEMEGVHVRGFCHRAAACAAALYEHPQAGLMLDLVRLNKDRSHVLVTTTPETGMDDPPNKRTIRFDGPPDVAALHERLVAECTGREPVPLTPAVFAVMFTTAYAAEMDWRIERGGVTRDEVLGAARAGGQAEPDEDSIEFVQAQWRHAIAAHWQERIIESFLETGGVSAGEWEQYRDRLCVVHAGTDRRELAVELASCALDGSDEDDDEDLYDQRFETITKHLNQALDASGDVLDNAAKAMDLMPPGRRLRLLGEVERPKKARIYVLPEAA